MSAGHTPGAPWGDSNAQLRSLVDGAPTGVRPENREQLSDQGSVVALSAATLDRVDTADGIDAGVRQALDERDRLRAENERLRGWLKLVMDVREDFAAEYAARALDGEPLLTSSTFSRASDDIRPSEEATP